MEYVVDWGDPRAASDADADTDVLGPVVESRPAATGRFAGEDDATVTHEWRSVLDRLLAEPAARSAGGHNGFGVDAEDPDSYGRHSRGPGGP